MERIKQALELARQDRIKNGGKVVGDAPIEDSSVDNKNIKYTQT